LGGAGVAGRDVVDSSFLNPAAAASAQSNFASLGIKNASESSDLDRNNHHIVLLDGSGDAISKGSFVFYKEETRSSSTNKSRSHWQVNLAKFYKPGLAMGVGFTKQNLKDLDSKTEFVDYNLNFGSQLHISEGLSLGFVAYNLFTGKDGRQSRSYALGSRWASTYVNTLVDIVYQEENVSNNRRLSAHTGLELVLHKAWVWRLGYASLGPEAHGEYTFGLQWLGPRLSFVYSYAMGTDNSAQKAHSVDLRVFF